MRLDYVRNRLAESGYRIDASTGWTVDASRGNVKVYASCPYDRMGTVEVITVKIDDTNAISSTSSYYTTLPPMYKYNNFEMDEVIALLRYTNNSGELLRRADEWSTEKILNVLQ